jgi:hypothetical protein
VGASLLSSDFATAIRQSVRLFECPFCTCRERMGVNPSTPLRVSSLSSESLRVVFGRFTGLCAAIAELSSALWRGTFVAYQASL